MNSNLLITIGLCFCIVSIFWNYTKAVYTHDSLYLKLTWLNISVAVMFSITYRIQSQILIKICEIVCYIVLSYMLLFSKHKLAKDEEKNFAISLLKDCDIDYHTFKKLNYQEQIDVLNNAIITWRDGTSDKLIEEESDLDDFRCILKKESK